MRQARKKRALKRYRDFWKLVALIEEVDTHQKAFLSASKDVFLEQVDRLDEEFGNLSEIEQRVLKPFLDRLLSPGGYPYGIGAYRGRYLERDIELARHVLKSVTGKKPKIMDTLELLLHRLNDVLLHVTLPTIGATAHAEGIRIRSRG